MTSISTPTATQNKHRTCHTRKSPSGSWFTCFSSQDLAQQENVIIPAHLKNIKAPKQDPSVKRVEYRANRPQKQVFTLHDKVQEVIMSALEHFGLPVLDISNIILEFHALYEWKPTEEVGVVLCHNNTVARNIRCSFGVVSGTTLDPTVDHIINLRIDDGVEFGFGVCTDENERMNGKRDFMCERGGWGYYNYKSKFDWTKPKYPCGWYAQTHRCVEPFDESSVLMGGDVLTLLVTREGLSDKSIRNGPCEGNGNYTLRFYKNNQPMGHTIRYVQGKLSICLNYYFMATTVRLLSNHKNSLKVLCQELRRD